MIERKPSRYLQLEGLYFYLIVPTELTVRRARQGMVLVPLYECIVRFGKESHEVDCLGKASWDGGAFGILCCEGTRKIFILQEGVFGWLAEG